MTSAPVASVARSGALATNANAARPTLAANGVTSPRIDLRRSVLLEPREQLGPSVARFLLTVGRAVVGQEAVVRIRIDDDFGGHFRLLQRLLHLAGRIHRDHLVLTRVQAEYRGLQ